MSWNVDDSPDLLGTKVRQVTSLLRFFRRTERLSCACDGDDPDRLGGTADCHFADWNILQFEIGVLQ